MSMNAPNYLNPYTPIESYLSRIGEISRMTHPLYGTYIEGEPAGYGILQGIAKGIQQMAAKNLENKQNQAISDWAIKQGYTPLNLPEGVSFTPSEQLNYYFQQGKTKQQHDYEEQKKKEQRDYEEKIRNETDPYIEDPVHGHIRLSEAVKFRTLDKPEKPPVNMQHVHDFAAHLLYPQKYPIPSGLTEEEMKAGKTWFEAQKPLKPEAEDITRERQLRIQKLEKELKEGNKYVTSPEAIKIKNQFMQIGSPQEMYQQAQKYGITVYRGPDTTQRTVIDPDTNLLTKQAETADHYFRTVIDPAIDLWDRENQQNQASPPLSKAQSYVPPKNADPKMVAYARQMATKYGLDQDLFLRLIGQESSWNPKALSSAGAYGYTQLMPDKQKSLGLNIHDPKKNIEGGAKYLSFLINKYNGNVDAALAHYNGGKKQAERILTGKQPNVEETRNYVSRVAKPLPQATIVAFKNLPYQKRVDQKKILESLGYDVSKL